MEQTVTLLKVQAAIKSLRESGERISRRNVLAMTGGGMSTVHRLMSQLEDAEAIQATMPDSMISPVLQKAIRVEIETQVQRATTTIQEHVCSLQGREQEALDSLARIEEEVSVSNVELVALKKQLAEERDGAEKDKTVSMITIDRLEKAVNEGRVERQELIASVESARIGETKALMQIEQFKQASTKADTYAARLNTELLTVREALAEAEKRVAVSKQQVMDLRKSLRKAEKRIKTLEAVNLA